MNEGDEVDRKLSRTSSALAWVGFPSAYFIALVQFPEYWAIATAIVFVIASGFFTSKVLLGLEGPWTVVGLAPVFGVAWLVLFWLLFKLID